MGCMGMNREDFCACTPSQFRETFIRWQEREQEKEKAGWEQTRVLAAMMLQPFSKKAVKPTDVLRFPWDSERKVQEGMRSTRERMEEVRKRMRKK